MRVLTLLALVAPALGAVHQVAVGQGGQKFDPPTVNAAPGDMVVWTFMGSHSVTSEEKKGDCTKQPAAAGLMLLDSGTKQTGTYNMTFPKAGTWWYYCIVGAHCKNGMEGVVKVAVGGAGAGGANSTTGGAGGSTGGTTGGSSTNSSSPAGASDTPKNSAEKVAGAGLMAVVAAGLVAAAGL
ncbi:hypothetical protein HK104_006224 [Borealophlyctis nickersoniae]|nr:hypothetical protein HK104_006224 [Borealophlyctis nickersoniae]